MKVLEPGYEISVVQMNDQTAATTPANLTFAHALEVVRSDKDATIVMRAPLRTRTENKRG